MGLQDFCLKKFKQFYAKKTLVELEAITGIQKTRMFRLLNGAPMKLAEYEILNQLSQGSSHQMQGQFSQLIGQCLGLLPDKSLDELLINMNQKLRHARLLRGY